MVKQGKFASVSALKKGRRLQHQQKTSQGRTIERTQLTEFMQVRYHLTQFQQQPALVQETMQRWLAIWLSNGTDDVWDVETVTTQTVQQIGPQVPWQFYLLVSRNWAGFNKFIQRELPNVPLEKRIRLQGAVDFSAVLSRQLSLNWFLASYAGNETALTRVTEQQVANLAQNFVDEQGSLAWDKIELLYQPVKFELPADSDDATQQWFTQLLAITE